MRSRGMLMGPPPPQEWNTLRPVYLYRVCARIVSSRHPFARSAHVELPMPDTAIRPSKGSNIRRLRRRCSRDFMIGPPRGEVVGISNATLMSQEWDSLAPSADDQCGKQKEDGSGMTAGPEGDFH